MRLLLAAALVALSTSSEAADVVPTWAHNGTLEEIVLTADAPTSLVDLATASDLIAEAEVIDQRSFLDRDGTRILTDYRVSVTQVLKARTVQTDPTVTVRRRGGTIPYGGASVVSSENGFRPFQIGERYVLFLRKSQQAGVYEIVSGKYGATPVIDGAVTSTTPLSELVDRVRLSVQSAAIAQAAK